MRVHAERVFRVVRGMVHGGGMARRQVRHAVRVGQLAAMILSSFLYIQQYNIENAVNLSFLASVCSCLSAGDRRQQELIGIYNNWHQSLGRC
jgi:hypothetical protein